MDSGPAAGTAEKKGDASLQLTAVYGAVLAASVLLLGSSVGSWIDRTRRIVAARTFLVVQNLSVAVAAVIFSLYMDWKMNEARHEDHADKMAAPINWWLVVCVC